MLDWTDRHCRYFHRLLSPNTRLYTEMITSAAIIHGDRQRLLGFSPNENPVILQIAGSEAEEMATAAKIVEDFGYDEININCGCPSERVQKGSFGACLMLQPDIVARCVEEVSKSVNIPVSVKCRTGVDDHDSIDFLNDFISKVRNAGCSRFVIHARKAWLKGLSPKENREIPPLDYNAVKTIKEAFPDLFIILNGGIKTLEDVKNLVSEFDGLMIGRAAYQTPYILAEIEREIFGNQNTLNRIDTAKEMMKYADERFKEAGTPEKSISRHMMGLFHGQKNGKAWRRALSSSQNSKKPYPKLIETGLRAINKEL